MIDDFDTFFLAGQETTANTLASCFLEIGKNNDILIKARDEIDTVLGERTHISYQDAIYLKYCNCIFKESLRLYPPVPMTSRLTTEEMIVNGFKIPKGTEFMVMIFKIKLISRIL